MTKKKKTGAKKSTVAGKKKKPAKVPPPPLRRPKAKRTPIPTMHPVDVTRNKLIKTTIEPDTESYGYLRYAAACDYESSIDGISLAQLHKNPMYAKVPDSTFTYWSVNDHWVDRRKAFIAKLQARAAEKVGNALIQERLRQLKKSQSLLENSYDLLDKKGKARVKPHTREGLINATVKLQTMVDEQQVKLSELILPEPMSLKSGSSSPAIQPQLSQAEAKAAAMVIVKMRRDEMRVALQKKAEKSGESDPPHMRVIKGDKDG